MQLSAVLFGVGSVGALLVDRFLRTREQKGSDTADMVTKISEAFDRTLETTMRYSQEVIDKMKQDDERSEARYRELELRYDKLERRFDEKEADRERLKMIVGKAVTCKHLRSGRNDDCPVIRENQKRLAAKCRTCIAPDKTSSSGSTAKNKESEEEHNANEEDETLHP